MDSNKSFEYQVPEHYMQEITYNGNVTRCMGSQKCTYKNCHKGCGYSNGPDKQNCIAMQNRYCKICLCHWTSHINSNKIFQSRTRRILITNELIKSLYEEHRNKKSLSQTALQAKIKQLQQQMLAIQNATKRMQKLQNELTHLQMSNNKPQSTKAYLNYLIQDEKKSQRPGYIKNIQKFNQAINQSEIYEKIAKGQFDGKQVIQKFIIQLKQKYQKKKSSKQLLGNTFKMIGNLFK